MKRHTKLAVWLLTVGCAFALSPAVSWSQQSEGAPSGVDYNWKVESQSYASPEATTVPVVQADSAMNLLDAPKMNFPTTRGTVLRQPPSMNPSSVPPVVTPETAALPIQSAGTSQSPLAVTPNRQYSQPHIVPIVPASSVESMLEGSNQEISGMPGQFAGGWETSDPEFSHTGHALYTNEVPSASQALLPQTQDVNAMTMDQLLEGSVPVDSRTGTAFESNVQATAAQWPTHEGGSMQLRPDPATSSFAPPIVQSSDSDNLAPIVSPAPVAARPVNSGLPVIQSQPSLSDYYSPHSGSNAVFEGTDSIPPGNQLPVINRPYDGGSMTMSPVNFSPMQDNQLDTGPIEMAPIENGNFGMGMDSVMDGGIVGDSYIQPPIGDAPVGGSDCTTCGNGPSVAGCPNCGVNGCYDQSAMASRFASCGAVAGAKNYFIFDTLYLDRGDMGRFGSTNAGTIASSDWDVGWSFLLGRRHDYTRGDEIGYWGTVPLETEREITNALPVFNALFVPGGFFGIPETGAFFNANQVIESRSTELHSAEYNQVRWNWDVYKSFAGLRMINVRDEYNLFMSNGISGGNLNIRTNNFLIGPQIGGELYPDIGYRGSLSVWTKVGAFLNFSELSTHIDNFGTNILDNDNGSLDIACTWELGATAHYQISSKARFRAGYTLFWLNNLSGATNNFPGVIGPGFGNANIVEEEMFFHGLSGGIEIYR
ncbi:MAG: hypothetical protein AAF456_24875 [Planctomycetota bacterium]